MAERRPSLAYRSLDAQVVAGRGEQAALIDSRGPVTYAELLHDSAVIAGALTHLGVREGDQVAIEVPRGRDQVISVLALARLGAMPHGTATTRIVGSPPSFVRGSEEPVPWNVLIQAGRTDPAMARPADTVAYETALISAYEDIFSTLTAGGTID